MVLQIVYQVVYLEIIENLLDLQLKIGKLKGENWIFSFDDKTKQGTIIAYVVDSNDNTILEFNSGEGEKNIKVPKDDTYKVKIKTEEHGGEFRISWKKEK